MHLATIGCNGQEILQVHLAAIGCNGLNSFYHPFYLDIMQGKIPGPLPLFCTASLGMAWVYPSYETSQYPICWHASFIDPHTHNDKSYFLFNVDSLHCIRPTPVY